MLEQARGQQAELEALSVWSSQLLQHQGETVLDASDYNPGVQDAWKSLSDVMSQDASGTTAVAATALHGPKWEALPLGRAGQWKQAVQTQVLSSSLKRTAALAADIQAQRLVDGGPILEKAVQTALLAVPDKKDVWLQLFDERLAEMQTYHARHDSNQAAASTSSVTGKRPLTVQSQQTAADGYDMSSSIHTWLQSLQNETLFSPQEVFGKYLDLEDIYAAVQTQLKDVFQSKQLQQQQPNSAASSFLYTDFLQVLSDGLNNASPEDKKLQHRKKYVRFLMDTETYLEDFLTRTMPLLSIAHVTAPAIAAVNNEWSKTGGFAEGWHAKPADAGMVQNNDDDETKAAVIDVSQFASAADLEKAVDGDALKTELSRLGLKCGGTVSDRAKRLFLLKNTPLDKLPPKVFAKKTNVAANDGGAVSVAKNERRVDIARREAVVTALLGQLRPTLEATIRRTERRQTQTLKERERELDEELYGSIIAEQSAKKRRTDADSDDSDDEDAPIYNPKNVPLDWDGKPMPYWLYKLHGLQHYYDCEICGGESYRGQRNFELHFADQKHALGMKSLGIPNTKHFHGVTTIDDAQELWKSLQGKLTDKQFDGTQDEEYEDSHGNVLSRTTYEDLARQGLL